MNDPDNCSTFFGLHQWEKWSKPELRDFVERLWTDNDNVPPEWKPRKMMIQERTCSRCGIVQIRRVKVTGDLY